MNKLVHDLSDAEKAIEPEEQYLAEEREGEAAAMAWLADETRSTDKALRMQAVQREAQEVARRRAEAESAAIEQARKRLKAETAARAMALERVTMERDNERLAKQRQEAESLALSEALRRQQANEELRAAIAARLQAETAAREAAEARVASEEAALQAANDKIRIERSLEAEALARAAAERDTAQLTEQRIQRESEAAQAKIVRRGAEVQLREATRVARQASERLADLGPKTEPVLTSVPEPSEDGRVPEPTAEIPGADGPLAPPRSGLPIALALVLGVVLGWFMALTSSEPAQPPAVETMQLDANAEAFGQRAGEIDVLRVDSPPEASAEAEAPAGQR